MNHAITFFFASCSRNKRAPTAITKTASWIAFLCVGSAINTQIRDKLGCSSSKQPIPRRLVAATTIRCRL